MRLLKKTLLVIIIAVVLAGLAGFVILPRILRPILTDKLTQTLHRQAAIGQIKINPFVFSVTVRDFKLAERENDQSFVSFDELYVNVAALSSLVRRAFILDEIRLQKPSVHLSRRADGSYNFSDLLPGEDSSKEQDSRPFLFSLNNIQIIDGSIDFQDVPHRTGHTVRQLNICVPFLSNIDYYMKNYSEPRFSAVVNGDAVSIAGKTKPFAASRDTTFSITLKDIDVPYYLQYVPVKMNFNLTQARLDTDIELHFIAHRDGPPSLRLTGHTGLRNVAMDDLRGKKIIRLPAVRMEMANVEPLAAKIHLSRITVEEPELVIRRDRHGSINMLSLVALNEKKGAGKPGADQNSKQKTDLLIDKFEIDKADLTFIDTKPGRAVKMNISPLNLSLSNFSLKKDERAEMDLALVVDRNCDITAKGSLGIAPVAADLALEVKRLAIRPFQPYFAESVQLDITRGFVSTAGKLSIKPDAGGKSSIRYLGDLSVSDLATIDTIGTHDFLKWKQLHLRSLAAGYNPLFVHIQEASLQDFFAKIVINKGGTTNIGDIFSNSKATAGDDQQDIEAKPAQSVSAPADAPPDIKIGRVKFRGGTVDFADFNISPNYAVTMLNLRGGLTGLSSQEFSRAKVALKGNIGYGSPLEIVGTTNPLKQDLFADIKITFKDLEMAQLTPYAIKFLGYPIIKGKLNFDVAYLVDKKQLRAENKFFFDQLTFGEQVKSPEAIKAPVTLAASLLTDRDGRINLDIPLSGSLDDPKFKVWPLVWQVLVNIITKAVTAPFSLLASLTGGGEEMSFVEFDYGSDSLPEEGIKKITALEKALYNRPQLKMEIAGYADAAHDQDALQKAELNRLIRAQKQKEMSNRRQAQADQGDVSVSSNEYEKYLTLAYKAAKFTKPSNKLGIARKLPVPEMEKLMLENIVITEGDLSQLAARRAQAVRERLLVDGKIGPERIFLVKPRSLTPQQKENAKESRVDFKLK